MAKPRPRAEQGRGLGTRLHERGGLELPSQKMDSRARVAFILATLILTNELAPALGFCSQRCGSCAAAFTIVITVWRVRSALQWAWEFGEFLDKELHHSRGLDDVPRWLLHHPPPVETKCKLFLFILGLLLDKSTQTIYRRHHVHLKDMFCSHEHCVTGKEIVKYLS